tara:strand:- start:292 stop:486 length:195 start_codon:yes stop_codon:yes gene_type:complete
VEDPEAESIRYLESHEVVIPLATIATKKVTLLESAENHLKVVDLAAPKARMEDASYVMIRVIRR